MNFFDEYGYDAADYVYRQYKINTLLNINDCNINGITLLHRAVIYGNKVAVHALLEFGADANINTSKGYSALHLASLYKEVSPEIISLLLKYGADVSFTIDRHSSVRFVLDAGGSYAYEKAKELILNGSIVPNIIAFSHRRQENMKAILKKQAIFNDLHIRILSGDSINIKDKRLHDDLASVSGDDPMLHPLKLAAAIGRSDVIKSFISFGVDIMPIKDELITIASKAKRHEVIAYFKSIDLINDEYDPSRDSCYNITVIDNQGRGSLHHAVEKSNIDRVRALISLGANINSLDINKISALHLAMQDWDVDIMIELISSGAYTKIDNEDGIGLMQCAISCAEIAVVDEILFHNPTNVNFISKYNISPLHQACVLDHPGNYDIVALLLEAKADLNLLDNDCKTPLQCILEGNIQNAYEIATSLILNGGNLEFLENTDQHESIKPLFSNNGWQDIHMQIFFGYELDLDKAASLMLSSNTSDIMLHPVKLAVVVGNLAALRQLVMHGVEVTSLKDELRCIASRSGSNYMVSYIESDFDNSKKKRDINSIFSENEGVVFYDSSACADPKKAGLKI